MNKTSFLKLTALVLLSTQFIVLSCKSQSTVFENIFANQNPAASNGIDPDLKLNQELWNKSKVCSYKLKIEASGSYPVGIFESVVIESKDGTILEVEWASEKNKEKITEDQLKIIENQYKNYLSVENLFDFIKLKNDEIKKEIDSRKSASGKLDVSYDATLGYPKEIKYVFFGSDGAQFFKVKDLEIINSGDSCR